MMIVLFDFLFEQNSEEIILKLITTFSSDEKKRSIIRSFLSVFFLQYPFVIIL